MLFIFDYLSLTAIYLREYLLHLVNIHCDLICCPLTAQLTSVYVCKGKLRINDFGLVAQVVLSYSWLGICCMFSHCFTSLERYVLKRLNVSIGGGVALNCHIFTEFERKFFIFFNLHVVTPLSNEILFTPSTFFW